MEYRDLTDTSESTAEQLARLMGDEHTDNSELVLSLAESTDNSPRLLGLLLGIAVFHKQRKTSTRALTLVRQKAGEEEHQLAVRLRESASYYYNEAAIFEKYQEEDFDLFDFILAAKMCMWHQPGMNQGGYFIQGHQTLDLTHFSGDVLPASVSSLHFIRYLSFPASKTFDLEASFEHLKGLPIESVFIENTRLQEFPHLLFQLPKLRSLQIKRGTQRPRQPMQVTAEADNHSDTVEIIQVDGYPISGEENLGPFPNLQEACFSRCKIQTLDFLKNSGKLVVLEAPGNELHIAPAFFAGFSHLQEVDLKDNPFTDIQLNLAEMPLLKKLELTIRR